MENPLIFLLRIFSSFIIDIIYGKWTKKQFSKTLFIVDETQLNDDYISGYANDMPSSKLAAMLLLGLRIIKKKNLILNLTWFWPDIG